VAINRTNTDESTDKQNEKFNAAYFSLKMLYLDIKKFIIHVKAKENGNKNLNNNVMSIVIYFD
jgi:hypothetical protein